MGNQVSSTFSLCFEHNSRPYRGVIFSKHGPSEMSRFFHGEFYTVNGLPMDFKPINVCNTNVGNIISKHMTFKPNKMKHYPPQIIFLQRILNLWRPRGDGFHPHVEFA